MSTCALMVGLEVVKFRSSKPDSILAVICPSLRADGKLLEVGRIGLTAQLNDQVLKWRLPRH